MRISITQVLVDEKLRYSFSLDASQFPKSFARNLELVIDRSNFFELPRLLRSESIHTRDIRLKLSIEKNGRLHTVHGDFAAFPETLNYLVWQSFNFHLRNSHGEQQAEAAAFKAAQDDHNHHDLVDAFTRVYGKISPTLYFNPHLVSRYAESMVQLLDLEIEHGEQPEQEFQIREGAREIFENLEEDDLLFLEVMKEIALALGGVGSEDINNFAEVRNRIIAHTEYLNLEYPDKLE